VKGEEAMAKISAKDRRKKNEEVEKARGTELFSDGVLKFFRKELDIDIIAEYTALKDVAKIPADKLLDRMELMRAINSCSKNARAANKVFLKARAAREFYRIDFDRSLRDLTRRATENVDRWMADNDVKKKQITKDMVQQELSSDPKLSKEYTLLIEKREEMRSIKSDCEVLATEWSNRQWTLRAQAKLVAAEREVNLSSKE